MIHDEHLEIEDSETEQDPDHSVDGEDDDQVEKSRGALDYASDSSDEEEGDSVVQEDILKFQQAFSGIKDRFRIIKRIGEGTLFLEQQVHFLTHYRHLLYCI